MASRQRFMFELTLQEVDDLVAGYFDAEPEALDRCGEVIGRLGKRADELRGDLEADDAAA